MDGCSSVTYDPRGVKCDANIEVFCTRWNVPQACCSSYVDRFGVLDIPLASHDIEASYILRWVTLLNRADEDKTLLALDACRFDQQYDRYNFVRDIPSCSRHLDFELRHRRRQTHQFLD